MDTICHIITKLELGGAQEVALHVVSHLDPAKYQAVLISGPGGLLTEEVQRLPHIELCLLPELGRRIHPVDDLIALVRLTKLLRRIRPSIVHTHSSKAGILGRWAAWVAGVPVIVHTVHGYGITPAQPLWLQRLLTMVERCTGWITTHWIAVAQTDITRGRSWGLFLDNVMLVRPGIAPEPFQQMMTPSDLERVRMDLGAQPGTYLVGTVACLKPQKAPEDFVEVAKLVLEARPDVRFVLIGDGELREKVESLIDQYGLQDRVYLAGWRRDVPAIMQALDTFLLTSHWEGLPRVLLEARASGLPIVATNVGGVEETITERGHAFLYEAGDCTGLAQGVLHILEMFRAAPKPVRTAMEDFPQEFHITEMVTQYESLYGSLCERLNRKIRHRPDRGTSHA
ncbi:MAG: glycosyltransferase family 4 protein [Nitrospira sp.]|nr:glycosyltransferase family 4 protein [Nitrospira sp.]